MLRRLAKCLDCGKTLESKFRHNFVECGCPNGAFVDGGSDYMRVGAKDFSRIQIIVDKNQPKRNKKEEVIPPLPPPNKEK